MQEPWLLPWLDTKHVSFVMKSTLQSEEATGKEVNDRKVLTDAWPKLDHNVTVSFEVITLALCSVQCRSQCCST